MYDVDLNFKDKKNRKKGTTRNGVPKSILWFHCVIYNTNESMGQLLW